jgi:membrane protease YdiL (CAAX protease family)
MFQGDHYGPTRIKASEIPQWRYGVGALIAVAFWQIGGVLTTLAAAVTLSVPLDALPTFPDTPAWKALAVVLASFIPLFFIVPLLYPLLLKLPWLTLITNEREISWRRIGHGFLAFVAILLPLSALDLILNSNAYSFTFRWQDFLPYLVICALLLPIQTTSEELFFRGWLLRWLSSGRLPIWLVAALNGAIFAAPHLFNPEVKGNYLPSFISYAAVGAMLALATIRDGTLELAIGAHFANNLLAGTLIGYQDSALPSAAIFSTGELNWGFSALISLAIIPVFLWLTRSVNSRPGWLRGAKD